MWRKLILTLGLLAIPALTFAQAVPTLTPAACVMNWGAPLTNADGSPESPITKYNVYTRAGTGVYNLLVPTAIVTTTTWPCATWATALPILPTTAFAIVTTVSAAGESSKTLCGPNPPSNACATEFSANFTGAALPGSVVNPRFGP
jgi:hypothetical protein